MTMRLDALINALYPQGGMNVVAMIKDNSPHVYVFLYDEDSRVDAVLELYEMIIDPDLDDFTPRDALTLSKSMRQLHKRTASDEPEP